MQLRDPRPIGQRTATGRQLRDQVPRSAHATWAASPDRPDPIDILEASTTDLLPELVPIRHDRMKVSAFTFFRGTAELMAADLATTPTTGLHAQLCGDCHLSNFGLYASPERELVFDINDFDETIRGPWEWDLKRLATSIEIAGRDLVMKPAARRLAVARALAEYRERLWTYAAMSPLDIRYDHRSMRELIDSAPDRAARRAREAIATTARRRDTEHLFPRLIERAGGVLRITDDPPVVFHPEQQDWRATVDDFLTTYRDSLAPEVRSVFDRYRFVDAAAKVSGIGSVGTRCFIALFLSDDDHPLILQAKEAGPSALAAFVDTSGPTHQGERVVVGQRIVQSASDLMLGWGRSQAGRDFYVRQLRDMKYSADISTLTPKQLATYASYCGWVLARAHAVSGDAATIAGYLGRGTRFDDAVIDFARTYADQNETDYARFLEALATGRLAATPARAPDAAAGQTG